MAHKSSARRKEITGLQHARRDLTPGRVTQLAAIEKLVAGIEDGLVEVRCASYCGPGSAGDRGAYLISVTGRIEYIVEKDGSWSR